MITYPDGYYVTQVFDQLNRLTDIMLNGATSSVAHFDYDELSRTTMLTFGNGTSTTYGYQSAVVNDLIHISQTFVGSDVTFAYGFDDDHQANSLAVTDASFLWHPPASGTTTYGTANSVNEYPTVGSAAYSYDGNASLQSDGTWTYGYDTENHLLTATKSGTSASYVYDPFHRQAQKTVGTTENLYYYSGWRRIADYNGTTNVLQTRYIYGRRLDDAFLQVSSSGVITYQHTDRVGSVIALSDSTGAVISKAAYSPFGEGTPPSGTTFGFTGQRYDAETGLYYYKRRYYNPVIGRFLQPDLVGDQNPYAYVDNNPLNGTDPYGLFFMVVAPTPPPEIYGPPEPYGPPVPNPGDHGPDNPNPDPPNGPPKGGDSPVGNGNIIKQNVNPSDSNGDGPGDGDDKDKDETPPPEPEKDRDAINGIPYTTHAQEEAADDGFTRQNVEDAIDFGEHVRSGGADYYTYDGCEVVVRNGVIVTVYRVY